MNLVKVKKLKIPTPRTKIHEKCAECGDKQFKIDGDHIWRNFLSGIDIEVRNMTMYHCPNCGETEYCFRNMEDLIELVDKEARLDKDSYKYQTSNLIGVEFINDKWTLSRYRTGEN
jgi:YgiT-type zinc finger domain-containing protein